MARAGAEGVRRRGLVSFLRRVGAVLQRIPRRRAWVPVLLWMVLITLLSSTPGRRGGGSPAVAYLSNLGHAPLFGLLGLWLALLLPRRDGWPRFELRGVLAVLVAVLLFGVMDELHQTLVVRRDLSALDLATDVTGAACVLWVAAHAGRAQSGTWGLASRLLVSAGLCLAVAAVATWLPAFFPGVDWM